MSVGRLANMSITSSVSYYYLWLTQIGLSMRFITEAEFNTCCVHPANYNNVEKGVHSSLSPTLSSGLFDLGLCLRNDTLSR